MIWIEDIPKSLIEKYQIKSDVNYSLYEKRLFTQAPTFFVLDETNKVVLKGADRFEVIEKLIELGIVEESVRDEFSKLNEN